MSLREELAERFEAKDLHDAVVLAVRIFPARALEQPTHMEVDFQCFNKEALTLVLERCANLSFEVDFDVLTENLFMNTSGLSADTSVATIQGMIRNQIQYWDLRYASDPPGTYSQRVCRLVTEDEAPISPLVRKESALEKLLLFKIQFFGGRLSVLAEDFLFKSLEVEGSKLTQL